jgi:putative transposase
LTKREGKALIIDVKGPLRRDGDFLGSAVEGLVHAAVEAEMTEAVGTERRLGHRGGYHERSLVTRVGTLEPRVPQDRAGRFSTELFERSQRSEKALVAALVEMSVQGVSTRKVKVVTEELCGHAFSASSIGAITKKLDASEPITRRLCARREISKAGEGRELKAFSERRLGDAFFHVILDARDERICEAGVIASQAVLIAVAVDWEGRRQVLAMELANRESRASWKDFPLALKRRRPSGVERALSMSCLTIIPASRPRYEKACPRQLGSAATCASRGMRWTTCRAKWMTIASRSCALCTIAAILASVRCDLAQWLARWPGKYAKLCAWVEDNIDETPTYYRLPLAHPKHMKSTDMLERLNQEIKRRTHVVRIFPDRESCLRLVRALAVEAHENWLEAIRYLTMEHLREHKKQALRALAA